MEAAYQRGHIAFSPEKTNSRLICLERLGALIDGAEGMIGTTRERRVKLLALWCHLLSHEVAPTKHVQKALGRSVHVAQFRRPTMGVLNEIWKAVGQDNPFTKLTKTIVGEVLTFGCLIPLAQTNLRAVVSGEVTCSDASSTGGGSCVSTGLTPLGEQKSEPEAHSVNHGLTDVYRAVVQATIPAISKQKRALIISVFDGIGALRVALDRLQVPVYLYVAVELDKAGRRCMRRWWPG